MINVCKALAKMMNMVRTVKKMVMMMKDSDESGNEHGAMETVMRRRIMAVTMMVATTRA